MRVIGANEEIGTASVALGSINRRSTSSLVDSLTVGEVIQGIAAGPSRATAVSRVGVVRVIAEGP